MRLRKDDPVYYKEKINKLIREAKENNLDVLDGMEVNFDREDGEIFEYIVNGEAYCLYPVFKEWCKYE